MEAGIPEVLLFLTILVGEDHLINSRKVAGVLCFMLFLKKRPESFGLGEEAEVLDLEQLLLLGLARDADLPSLIEFWEQLALVQVEVCALFFSPPHSHLFVKHTDHMGLY